MKELQEKKPEKKLRSYQEQKKTNEEHNRLAVEKYNSKY